jgi:prepilin-type N-terminal cleavage/methylation domain-containing protein
MTSPRSRMPRMRTRDDGFTVVELITVVGILSLLMAIISTFAVNGIRTIRGVTDLSTAQAQAQEASEWISRLLRYADNPVETVPVTPAVTYGGYTSGFTTLTFHTFSGTGGIDRVPYKVTVKQSSKGIETFLWAPDMSSGTPTYLTSPRERILVPQSPGNTPSLRIRYWAGTAASPAELIPPTGGTLTTAQLNSLRAIQFLITGSGSNMVVDRTVILENPRA